MTDETNIDDESIVLEMPRGYAQVGDPTGNGIIDLRDTPIVDGSKHLELPADGVDVARGLLKNHDRASVVSDPTDSGLADVKSEMEVRKEENQRMAREHNKKREKKNRGFDPVNDQPSNHRKVRVKNIYDQLADAGEDEKAEKLRDIRSLPKQDRVAQRYGETLEA